MLGLFVAEITLAACAEPVANQGENTAKMQAREVKIELGDDGGRIEIRGDRLTVADAGAVIRLSGNAEVEMDTPVGFGARALKITLNTKTSRLELAGDVRAQFRIDERGPRDAGM